jgi:glycosyltransferase involved in cell wall biosynthesis
LGILQAAVASLVEPLPSRRAGSQPARLRVAMLAPPWIAVPPPGYGGIEAVVAILCEGLVGRGHEVTLFAAPGSRSPARVRPLLESAHPEEIQRSLYEVDHVATAFDAVDAAVQAGRPFDVVHDHCGFAAFANAHRITCPVLHTLHGPFTLETYAFYRRHAHKASVVAISRAQLRQGPPELRVAGVIPNSLDVASWPYRAKKDGYLLWVGRMTPEKGPHRAIAAARRAGRPLVIAGPVQPGQEAFFAAEVAPHVDSDAVRYVGEVGGSAKGELFAGAHALLMPIQWPEPFGMVMVEAMASGTPVIAFAQGSAEEIVRHGETGFLVEDEEQMAAAVAGVCALDPAACRAVALERYDIHAVVAAYELAYRTLVASPAGARPSAEAVGARQPAAAGVQAVG